jgi:hypothetical protein
MTMMVVMFASFFATIFPSVFTHVLTTQAFFFANMFAPQTFFFSVLTFITVGAIQIHI